jgi:hypothetical protein
MRPKAAVSADGRHLRDSPQGAWTDAPRKPEAAAGCDHLFEWVRIRGNRAFGSGHRPLAPDGTPAGPFGKVPSEVPAEAAEESVRLTALAVNFGLQQAIGDLDRIAAWAMLNGWVNADPGYAETTPVFNPFSDLIGGRVRP